MKPFSSIPYQAGAKPPQNESIIVKSLPSVATKSETSRTEQATENLE